MIQLNVALFRNAALQESVLAYKHGAKLTADVTMAVKTALEFCLS